MSKYDWFDAMVMVCTLICVGFFWKLAIIGAIVIFGIVFLTMVCCYFAEGLEDLWGRVQNWGRKFKRWGKKQRR